MSFIFNTTLDEELDRYANAENAIAANLGSNLNNTKKQYNVATNKNEFFKNNEGGGYVKVFEQELTALEDAQMYNQSLLDRGMTPTADDFYAAGFDDAVIAEGGFINVQPKSGITEPLTEEVQQQAFDLGFDVVSPVDDPVFKGSIKEISKGLAVGGIKNPALFLSNALPKPESTEDQKIGENLFDLEGSFQFQIFDPETGEFDPAIKFASSDEINAQIAQIENGQRPYAVDLESLLQVDEQSGTGAKVLGTLSQFVGAYAGLGKFFRFGKSNFMKGFTGGAAADFLAFEGNEGRLSDIIYDVGEALGVEIPQNVIVDFMKTDPNDPDYVGRFKTALEGGVLGVLAEPILIGLGKTFRAIKDGDITQNQVLPFVKAATNNMQETFSTVVKNVGERLNQPGQMPPLGSNLGNVGQFKINPDEVKQVLQLRASQMQLPTNERIQPSTDNMFDVTPESYNATFPEQKETPVPRVPEGKTLPLKNRGAAVIEMSDAIVEKLAERAKPFVGSNVQYFYHTGPLIDKAIDLGISKEQAQEQLKKFASNYAATSPRTQTEENLRSASIATVKQKRDLDIGDIIGPGGDGINEKGYPMMIGRKGELDSKGQPLKADGIHRKLLEAVQNDGISFATNPKPATFAENVSGNLAGVTVDTHAIRAVFDVMNELQPGSIPLRFIGGKNAAKTKQFQEMYKNDPSSFDAATMVADTLGSQKIDGKDVQTEYAIFSDIYKAVAEKLGVQPAEAQSLSWFANGDKTGLASEPKTIVELINDRVDVTAQLLNQPKDQVFKKFLQGSLPLLSVGGLTLLETGAQIDDESM